MQKNLHAPIESQSKSTDSGTPNGVTGGAEKTDTRLDSIQVPSIALPRGGGALKGIDEQFEVNAANGTATCSIPLPITPGRRHFSPELTLSYNSGAGNGPFGLGWSLGLPSIQRKTDRKVPQYHESPDEDGFMFSGAEDLVPFLDEDLVNGGFKVRKSVTSDDYTVITYRPRLESRFDRIEKIHHKTHGVYWKITTGSNVATIFGRDARARIADPHDRFRIFRWLPEFSYDGKGNWIRFHCKKDSNTKDDRTLSTDDSIPHTVYEKNRKSGLAPYTNTYLKRVTYGNRSPYYADPSRPYDPRTPENEEYFFELVLDYGEHNEIIPTPQEDLDWNYREDAFSSYRAGFEIRTNRLCRRILMFHHFKEEKQFVNTPEETEFGVDYLVRSLDVEYEPSSINQSGQCEVTYLSSIVQSGYIRKPDGSYSRKSLPPMEFTYEKLNWNKRIKTVSEETIANAPGKTFWKIIYGGNCSKLSYECKPEF